MGLTPAYTGLAHWRPSWWRRLLQRSRPPRRIPAEGAAIERERTCRGCGCTESKACPGGCYWAGPNVCSNCTGSLLW